MRCAWLLFLVACGAGSKREARLAFVSSAGDAAAMQKLMQGSVTNGGLWFEDSACANEFGKPGEVPQARFAVFSECLAKLNMQKSKREDPTGEASIMTYGPGFEVEARVTNERGKTRLVSIGYAMRSDPNEALTLTREAFEALRTGGEPDGPLDPSIATYLELDPTPKSHSEYAWLKVCIDDAGEVNQVTAYESTSPAAHTAFTTAATKWTFKPFLLAGKPVPACAMLRPAYPPGGGPLDEVLPLPVPDRPAGTPIVIVEGAKSIESKRVEGNRSIVPDDQTKLEIHHAAEERVTGSFRVCIDENGKVESVKPFRSTGFPNYDKTLISEIQRWVYQPSMIAGQPTAVCTGVTFVYVQK